MSGISIVLYIVGGVAFTAYLREVAVELRRDRLRARNRELAATGQPVPRRPYA